MGAPTYADMHKHRESASLPRVIRSDNGTRFARREGCRSGGCRRGGITLRLEQCAGPAGIDTYVLGITHCPTGKSRARRHESIGKRANLAGLRLTRRETHDLRANPSVRVGARKEMCEERAIGRTLPGRRPRKLARCAFLPAPRPQAEEGAAGKQKPGAWSREPEPSRMRYGRRPVREARDGPRDRRRRLRRPDTGVRVSVDRTRTQRRPEIGYERRFAAAVYDDARVVEQRCG